MTRFDQTAADRAAARQATLTKPAGSLGRLEALAVFMAGWQGTDRPTLDRAQALVFAGNHGICAQGVNPFPQEVTARQLAELMVGSELPSPSTEESTVTDRVLLAVRELTVVDPTGRTELAEVSFDIHAGEVLFEGAPHEIVDDPEVRRVYLGERFS